MLLHTWRNHFQVRRGFALETKTNRRKTSWYKPSNQGKSRKGFSAENVAKMEQEMKTVQRDLKAIETNYGKDVLCLAVTRSYIRKPRENPEVKRFLSAQYADVLSEFASIVENETLR